MSIHNMHEGHAATAVADMGPLVLEAMTRRDSKQVIRPSSGLACARQTYYMRQGEQMQPMPDNIGLTFAIGHALHQLSYAAMRSAIPDCFDIETEKSVRLPAWWPVDEEHYNQRGTVGMFLRVNDWAAAKQYIPTTEPTNMLVDFKSMGGYSIREQKKKLFGEDPDGFGYMAQLTVYSDSPDIDTVDTGSIVAAINRDSLAQPLVPRLVSPRVLQAERDRLIAALQMAEEGNDPGEEFLNRHDDDANFFCGRAGRAGYCGCRERCKAEPTR